MRGSTTGARSTQGKTHSSSTSLSHQAIASLLKEQTSTSSGESFGVFGGLARQSRSPVSVQLRFLRHYSVSEPTRRLPCTGIRFLRKCTSWGWMPGDRVPEPPLHRRRNHCSRVIHAMPAHQCSSSGPLSTDPPNRPASRQPRLLIPQPRMSCTRVPHLRHPSFRPHPAVRLRPRRQRRFFLLPVHH